MRGMLKLLWPFLVLAACAGGKPAGRVEPAAQSRPSAARTGKETAEEAVFLDRMAEQERSGNYRPGMGVVEAGIRERAGDYAGSVLAVFKDLSWAYSRGVADKERVRNGIARLIPGNETDPADPASLSGVGDAARAVLAFFEGRWKDAEPFLREQASGEVDPDAFSRWMLLVCELEQNPSRGARAAYGSIRARYVAFPEYWYHAARSAETGPLGIGSAGDYAEVCINMAPQGPFAAECRSLMAVAVGLKVSDGPAFRTRGEIETVTAQAAEKMQPELVRDLFPLLGLADNPNTLYAAGVLKALAMDNRFRSWFAGEAGKASGRLAERLRFVIS